MAKRKAARATGRKKSSAKQARRKAAPRRARKAARPRSSARGAKKAASRKRSASFGSSRVKSKAKKSARSAASRKVVARKASPRKASARKAVGRKARSAPAIARKAPALNRERRIVRDEDIVPTPPSSLDLDRSASAARSGRRELAEKYHEHTETSPAITGGDIDADWESAYSVGDEAPGGDNPTPDQDIVDDIGRAIGVQYEDNEELKGEKKISDRDRKRWELDPASAEDYNEHEED
jgi:hypothetical protein